MLKFGRNYALSVQIGTGNSTAFNIIKPPLTLELEINKTNTGGANNGVFRVFNLSKERRSEIRYDYTNFSIYKGISLLAGYGNNLSVVFKGNITNAFSAREGANFVTTIIANDGGLGLTNANLGDDDKSQSSAGMSLKAILTNLAGTMNKPEFGNIGIGKIGDFPDKSLLSKAYNGNTAQVLSELSGKAFYIENEKIYILKDNEFIDQGIKIIDASTGLLETPLLESSNLTVTMLFEPDLLLNQRVQLNSVTADASFNTTYKVITIKHHAIISDAVCGDATTTATLARIGDLIT